MALGDVALVTRICEICGKEYDAEVIMNGTSGGKSVKELHGKCVGFLEEPCDECKELLDKAFILIIYDPSKSDGRDLYRTGQIFGIRKDSEFVKNLTNAERELGWSYIDYLTAKEIGLPC